MSDFEQVSFGNNNDFMINPEQSLQQRLSAYVVTAVQLAFILFVVRAFAIEDQEHFFTVMALAAAGFLIHWWLPALLFFS